MSHVGKGPQWVVSSNLLAQARSPHSTLHKIASRRLLSVSRRYLQEETPCGCLLFFTSHSRILYSLPKEQAYVPNVSSAMAPCPESHMAEHLLPKLLPRSTCRNSTASLSDGQGAWNCDHMLGMIRLAVCSALAKAPVLPAEMCHLLPALTCHCHGMGWDVKSEAWQITHPAAASPCCAGQGRDYLGSFSASPRGLPSKRQQCQVVTG